MHGNRILPWVLGGVAGGVGAAALRRPRQPGLPDFTTLLTEAPTTTAANDYELARKRTLAAARAAKSLTTPRATILTGSMGTAPAPAPQPRKTTIGGGY